MNITAVTLLAACLLPSGSSTSRDADAKAMVVVPFEDAKFVPISPRLPEGPRVAVLWGDPDTGPSAILLEMSKGAVPLHIHGADYHLVVVEGTMKHWAQGQASSDVRILRPGSYWFQPGGQVHGDECLTEKCVMQIVWSGARDAALAVDAEQFR